MAASTSLGADDSTLVAQRSAALSSQPNTRMVALVSGSCSFVAWASVDRIGVEEECKVGEGEVIPASVPSSAVPDSRASASITSIVKPHNSILLYIYVSSLICFGRELLRSWGNF